MSPLSCRLEEEDENKIQGDFLMKEESYVVSIRVSELPEPYVKSIQHNCCLCGEPCWVSVISEEVLIGGWADRVMCMECLLKEDS